MKLQLIHFITQDQLRLPGLLYEPSSDSKKVAIYLHGNGTSSIFYSPLMNILGKQLTNKGITFFPFNNRGANLIKSLTKTNGDRVMYGTAYELIKECIFDINAAIDMLKEKGYEEFYLIGESTGANKIVVYHYYEHDNQVSKYVLLSGGDDTGLYFEELGKKLFFEILKMSKQKIDERKGIELLPQNMYQMPMSYQSMFDTLNPDGDYNIFPFNESFNQLNLSTKELFKEFKRINKKTLVVYGSEDEFCYGKVPECIELLKTNSSHPQLLTFNIIQQADHGFHGKESELSILISDFLK